MVQLLMPDSVSRQSQGDGREGKQDELSGAINEGDNGFQSGRKSHQGSSKTPVNIMLFLPSLFFATFFINAMTGL